VFSPFAPSIPLWLIAVSTVHEEEGKGEGENERERERERESARYREREKERAEENEKSNKSTTQSEPPKWAIGEKWGEKGGPKMQVT
jgi:hypothetical protein